MVLVRVARCPRSPSKWKLPATVAGYGQRAAHQRWRQPPPETGSLALDVEGLGRYRDDPIRLRMLADMLGRQAAGHDDPPLGPAALAAWHEQNRRAQELVLARLAELNQQS